MKHTLLFLLLLSTTAAAFAQDWAPVRAGEKYNFRKDSSDVITHTLWVDSVTAIGGDSVFLMNTTFGRCEGCGPDTNEVYFRAQSPHFLQKSITKLAHAHYQLADTGLMDIQAFQPVGASWMFEPSLGVTATVQSESDSMFWGSVADSVKTLVLSDGGRIVLSKHHGILLWDRPDVRYRLTGLQEGRVLGEQVPMFWDFYDYEVGDVFQYVNVRHIFGTSQNFTNGARQVKILSKDRVSIDSVSYEIQVNVQKELWALIPYALWYGEYYFSKLPCVFPCTRTEAIAFKENSQDIANAWPGEYRPERLHPSGVVHFAGKVALVRDSLGSVSKYWGGWRSEDLGELPHIDIEDFDSKYPELKENYYLSAVSVQDTPIVYWPYNSGEVIMSVFYPGLGIYFNKNAVGEGVEGELLLGYVKGNDTTGDIFPESTFWPVGLQPDEYPATFSLYPNPVAPGQSLRLEADHADSWELRLIGMDGKLLFAKSFAGEQIELALPAMPSGLYVAELRGRGGTVMRRKLFVN